MRGPHTAWLGGEETRNREQWGAIPGSILEPLLCMFSLGMAMVWMGPPKLICWRLNPSAEALGVGGGDDFEEVEQTHKAVTG